MNLTKEAKIHSLLQIPKLKDTVAALEKMDPYSEDELFAQKLGNVLLACDIFVSNTKHQHRTLCDIMKGKRA